MAGAFGDLGSLTEPFMTAAVDPTRWNAAMDAAAEATDSFGAILLPVRGRAPSVPTSQSMLPTMDAYVRGEWAQKDERYRSVPSGFHAARRRLRIRFHDAGGDGAQSLLPGTPPPTGASMVRRGEGRRRRACLGSIAPTQRGTGSIFTAGAERAGWAIPPPRGRGGTCARLQFLPHRGRARCVRGQPFARRDDRPHGRGRKAQPLRRASARTRPANRPPPRRLLKPRRNQSP